MSDIRVSVIMPVYNGALYLAHQLDSIIPMLAENDEIIISYDKSTDDTLKIAKEYAKKDSRIRLFINRGEGGVWPNSLNALKRVRGKYIIPSDQDDEWINDKINVIVSAFNNKKVMAVLHDGYVCDKDLNIIMPTILDREKTSNSWVKNFIKSSVAGCCLAYRSEFVKVFLKTPIMPDAADQWAAISAMILGKVRIIKPILTKHRIHENNFTPKYKRKLSVKLKGRLFLAIDILWLFINKRRFLTGLFD